MAGDIAEPAPSWRSITKLEPDGPAIEPQERAYFRGVASVSAPAPVPDDTGAYGAHGAYEEPARPAVSEAAAPRGMVVRRRWRQLRSGAGWTWTGASVAVVCWGIWAVSLRGGDLLGPLLGLLLVFATGALIFTVSRLFGRVVLENTLGRERRGAWASHLATCVLLSMAGFAFLQQTPWVVDAWNWVAKHL